jgi:hypothetical protein
VMLAVTCSRRERRLQTRWYPRLRGMCHISLVMCTWRDVCFVLTPLHAPSGWRWLWPSWVVDKSGESDGDGWSYAFNWTAAHWYARSTAVCFVRR